MIEMMLVVGVMGVISGLAIFQIGSARPYMKGDGAMRIVLAQMNTARELSISQRRNIQLTFSGNVITMTRQNIAIGAAAATTTVLSAVPMEGGVQFVATSGVADLAEWTGGGFATTTPVFFSSDGSLIGSSGLPVNNLVFMTILNQPRALRAVSISGPTGRIRAYAWEPASLKWLKK